MKLKLLTWNSININNDVTKDGTAFRAYIPPPQMANQSNNPVLVNRANQYPFLSVAQRNASFITINVIIDSSLNTYREILKKYFFSDLNRHNLVAQDENDGNRQYYRTGIPISLAQEGNNINSFLISIQTEYPYWQIVNATADSWDITATGDSDIIANIGNINVPPIFTITPTTTKTKGLKYRRFATIYNNMDKSLNIPLDITNGGLDVQSLIDANKMQASGNDFLVWKDGSFTDRWLSGMDSDSDPAKCWVNYQLNARHEATTLSTFDSDDTTLYLSQTRANKSFLQSLKVFSNKLLLIDSELLSFSDSDIDLINYTISNVSRSQKDTTAVSHLALSTVRHIEHDLWIMYGDSDLGTPDIDDRYKPVLDLTSTNLAWNYTNYFDNTSARPGAWKPEIQATRTGLSYTFTDSDPTQITNPSTRLGLAMIGGSDFQIANEAGTLDWLFTHPCGVTQVVYSGESYNTGSWPAIIGLQYLHPNLAWITAQQETEPTVTQAWQSFGPHTVSLGGVYEAIRHVIDGQLDSITNEMAMVQFNGHTISFDSDNLPFINLEAEESINFFDFKLTNNTTGEYIKVQSPCPVNSSLTIDCANKKAYLQDGSPVNVILSTDRQSWLDLQPGNNSLQYDDIGTVAVNVVITHRDRTL